MGFITVKDVERHISPGQQAGMSQAHRFGAVDDAALMDFDIDAAVAASAATSSTEMKLKPARRKRPREQQMQQAEPDQRLTNGKIPDDIPETGNDSVFEAQIRAAAMAETDPNTQKNLWNEYRRYKGLPEKE